MGGAVSLLSRRRALGLAALLAGLVAYGLAAPSLPALSERSGIAFQSFVVLPAFVGAIWVALPLARNRSAYLFAAAAGVGVVAVGLSAAGPGGAASVAKLSFFALLGYWFLSLFEHLWWLALVAVLVPSVDIWSVFAGPTGYIVENQPSVFDHVAVMLAGPGDSGTAGIGPPDVLFFALFLAAADRFRLRVAWTWLAMTALLATTLILVWTWDGISGLPALPAVCLGFLLSNADLLWRNARDSWREAHGAEQPG